MHDMINLALIKKYSMNIQLNRYVSISTFFLESLFYETQFSLFLRHYFEKKRTSFYLFPREFLF